MRGLAFATVVTVAVAALPAQAELVQDLGVRDPVKRQRAVRTLLAMPLPQLPVAALQARLPDPIAAGILAARPELRPQLAAVFEGTDPEAWRLSLPAAPTAWLLQTCADAEVDGSLRAAAVAELQQRGELRDGELAALLCDLDDDVARTAAAVLVYERQQWSEEFWRALRAQPHGQPALLAVLAMAPRAAGEEFAARVAADAAAPPHDRVLAIAALPPARIDRGMALAVVAAAAAGELELGSAARLAAGRLPDALADAMIGELHRLLLQGTKVEALLPLLERLGPNGQRALLGICASVPAEAQLQLVRPLQNADAPALRERCRAALHGEIPLEPWLLGSAPPLLDRESRIARVAALLDAEAPATALAAFDTLCKARVYVPAMLRFCQRDDADPGRLRQLCDLGPELVPLAVFEAAIAAPDCGRAAMLALERQPLPPALERRLLDLAQPREAGELPLAEAACRLLLVNGSENAGRTVWQRVRQLPVRQSCAAVDWLAQGRRPWVAALWLSELDPAARPRLDDELLDCIRLALAESGDRRTIDDLVASAGRRPGAFVRRCRRALPEVGAARALRLIDAALACRDQDTRIECLVWAGGCTDDAVQQKLLQLWHDGDDDEVLEAAARGLMLGPARARMLELLQQALQQGRFDGRTESLAYEAVASMPQELRPQDVELLAQLLLQAPLGAPDAELRRADMFADGRAGFPMAAAVVDRLRRDADVAVEATFARVAADVAARPDVVLLARQRLLCLWTAAAALPARQQQLGRATAALLLAIPDLQGRGDGPAHWFLGGAAEAAGDFAAAAAHHQRAIERMLRLPPERLSLRIFLGDRDLAAGHDPLAALAARPHLCRARDCRRRGDPAAAAAALQAAREFAGRDAATLAEIDAVLKLLEKDQ